MIKDEIPRGQLSTIILMTLEEKDKYGYEIIDEVLKSTNGKVSIKQPSLYSSLKRMEEQALISSYWRDSDIGGRRHYYHLTDLGKKHLQKWKQDLPTQYLQQSQEDTHTRVLQQESLFNITNNNTIVEKKLLEEQKKDNAFVQFDLFTNSTMVTPFVQEDEKQEQMQSTTNDEQNKSFIQQQVQTDLKQEEIQLNEYSNELLKQEQHQSYINSKQEQIISNKNPILTSYKKPIEKKEYAFDYVKKNNKSFSDCFKSNEDYEKKYLEKNLEQSVIIETEKNTQNYGVCKESVFLQDTNNHFQKDYTQEENTITNNNYIDKNDSIKDNSLLVDNSETKHDIDKEYLYADTKATLITTPQNEEQKDDAVFITERLSAEDMPKPAKWDKRRFEVYLTANSVAPDLKRSKNSDNYEDRIKDLYELSKLNAENRELELIDDKVKFNSYKTLQDFYKEQNIKFKPFEKTLKATQKDYSMVKISKLNMLSALFIFLYIGVISASFGVINIFVPQIVNSPFIYITLPTICFGIFVYYLVGFIKTPQKQISYDMNKYKFKIKIALICLLLIPIIFAINLISGFSFAEFSKYLITIIYPICIVSTYFAYYPFKKLLLKFKFIH